MDLAKRVAHTRKHSQRESPTLMLLVLIAVLGAVAYGTFILDPANRGDTLPYVFVLIAETFLILQAIIALWTMLAGSYDPRGFEYHDAQEHLFSPAGRKLRYGTIMSDEFLKPNERDMYLHGKPLAVDVFVTVYGEPLETIKETLTAAMAMAGKHTTYVLDDGGSDDVKKLAFELGVRYIPRSTNEGAKAGNINNALTHSEGEYFAVLDADFVPKQSFLYELLPFFEDEHLAFAQSPQFYRNSQNLISRGAGFMQSVFYRLIMPGKNRFNAAFCVGTNVIFRRSAIEAIGGIYQKSKSEDIWTSLLLHERGYKSVYVPDVLAVGSTPDTIKAYSKQQLRWATGGFQIFFHHNPLSKKLSTDQKLQYLATTTYYFQGLAMLLLFMLPVLHIFFNLTPVNLSTPLWTWLVFYLSFYGLQMFLAFYTIGGFRLESLVLAMASFPIYIRALLQGLFQREESWQATGNRKGIDSPYNYIVPQILIFVFLIFTSAVGVWKTYYYEVMPISLIWCLLNTLVFGVFLHIARKEHRALRLERKRTRAYNVRPVATRRGYAS